MGRLDLRYLYFDIDGTLCDYGLDPRKALRMVCRDLDVGANLDPYEYYDVYKVVAREFPGLSHSETSTEAYARLLLRQGIDDRPLAERISAGYRRLRLSSIHLYPDARVVLEKLSESHTLGIISNGPSEIQWAKLEQFDLKRFFDTIVISGDVGSEKPESAIFLEALRRIDAPADESAHVGDDLEADVVGAIDAGMTSFWVNRGVLTFEGCNAKPHFELRDLADLLSVLEL